MKRPHRPMPQSRDPVQRAFREQDSIGWYQFLMGRLSKSFAKAQSSHFKHLKQSKSGTSWVRSLIVQILELPWKMWDHRNQILHDPNHPSKLEHQLDVAIHIQEQFDLGDSTLWQQDKHMLHRYSPEHLGKLPLHLRESWLSQVQQARQLAAALPDPDIIPADPNQPLLTAFLAPPVTPLSDSSSSSSDSSFQPSLVSTQDDIFDPILYFSESDSFAESSTNTDQS